MANKVDVELMRYRSIQQWKPMVGDIIIKHGWISRTKWFGVVNTIAPNGVLNIIKDSLIKLLVATAQHAMHRKSTDIPLSQIASAVPGTYTAMQPDPATGVIIWYV